MHDVAESGQYLNTIATDTRPGFTARQSTRYMNTTGRCIELFFQSPMAGASTVSVIAVSEDIVETTLVSSDGSEPPMWNRLFAVLPAGINRVVVEGRRSLSGFSSLSVDDIVIRHCSTFGKLYRRSAVYSACIGPEM